MARRSPILAATLFLLALASPGGLRAQVRLTVDNDLFGPRGADDAPPDYEYTHGTRVEVFADRVRWWAVPLGLRTPSCGEAARGGRCLRTRYEAGQRIYTPRNDAAEPIPGERPYAGWLYAAAAAEEAGPRGARSVGVEVGVTGPPSLAERVQTELHRLAGYRPQLGWRSQLRFEPAFALRYAERRVAAAVEGERLSAGLAPEWEVALGTLRTGAAAGARGSVGFGGAYLEGALRQEWVARDLFLDGNTFGEGPRVTKRPFVAQAELGVGFRFRRVEARYRAVWRGREYRTQADPHRYGSLTFTLHPRE